MSIPRHDFINSEPSSSSQIPNLSQAQLYAGLAKLEYLTYRIGHLSSFVSAADEAVAFSTEFSSNLIYFSGELVMLTEAARKTLEAAEVIPYLWASCPDRLTQHKRAYIELLHFLHSNERYIDTQFLKRFRALLMPLTSQFSISKNGGDQQLAVKTAKKTSLGSSGDTDTRLKTQIYNKASESHEASRQEMPPPDAFRTASLSRSESRKILPHTSSERLWAVEELIPTPTPGKRRKRDVRLQTEDKSDELENDANDSITVPFRQPRATLRFGICFSRKTSSHSSGRRSNTRSLMSSKE